jgi:protein-tyrosine-phosphatase
VALQDHESRTVTPELVQGASLVIGHERAHVRELVLMAPPAWPRTFTLKELVRRGEQAGARRHGEAAESWIERVHAQRAREDLLGDDASDDVRDPMGGSREDFEYTAGELNDLVTRLADLLGRNGPSGRLFGSAGYSARTTAASP